MEPPPEPRRIPRERLEYVEKLWLSGKPEHRIQQLVAKRYEVTLRTGRRYIALVRTKLAALPKPDPAAVVARAEAMLLTGFEKARTRKLRGEVVPDASAMVSAAWRVAELHGAVAPKQHQVSGPGGGPIPLSDARTALAAAIAAAVADPDPGGEDPPSGESS